MLWLCLYLPRLPLDALAEPAPEPAAVVTAMAGRRRLLSCNESARRWGIADGDDASAAQAVAPGLRLLSRSVRAEQDALQGIAGWAYQFTDRLAIEARESDPGAGAPFFAVLAEISGSLALFGGLPKLLERVARSFAPLGYAHRIAVAPTPAAAETLALAGDPRPVIRSDEIVPRLAPLPVKALSLAGDVLEALRGVGVRTVGECLRLPRDQVARRFGAEASLYLRRLVGELPDPRPSYTPPQEYRRRFELAGAIDRVEALMFPLKRLLLELQGVLVARDTAVLRLALELEHEDHPATRVALNLAAPRRDAQQLLGLLRERLERTPAAAVEALVLKVEEFAEPASGQQDFFDEALRRQESGQRLIERLVARLGPDAVRRIGLRAEHRPEASFMECGLMCHSEERQATRDLAVSSIKGQIPRSARNDTSPFPPRPLWLLREPRPLAQPPLLLSRAERIEAGWWDGKSIVRDYHVAETSAGSRLWVFREQDQWFLHGIWS